MAGYSGNNTSSSSNNDINKFQIVKTIRSGTDDLLVTRKIRQYNGQMNLGQLGDLRKGNINNVPFEAEFDINCYYQQIVFYPYVDLSLISRTELHRYKPKRRIGDDEYRVLHGGYKLQDELTSSFNNRTVVFNEDNMLGLTVDSKGNKRVKIDINPETYFYYKSGNPVVVTSKSMNNKSAKKGSVFFKYVFFDEDNKVISDYKFELKLVRDRYGEELKDSIVTILK